MPAVAASRGAPAHDHNLIVPPKMIFKRSPGTVCPGVVPEGAGDDVTTWPHGTAARCGGASLSMEMKVHNGHEKSYT
jgi:hypothetical protein